MPDARETDAMDAETQIAQVATALATDLGEGATTADVKQLAAVAYLRVAKGARVRSFLPVLAEREARRELHELETFRVA
jgi:hypothetical protein